MHDAIEYGIHGFLRNLTTLAGVHSSMLVFLVQFENNADLSENENVLIWGFCIIPYRRDVYVKE